jgi:hypothetical protein
MLISELIKRLEKALKEHGDMHVKQECSREELIMNIHGCYVYTSKTTGKKSLCLDDGESDFYHEKHDDDGASTSNEFELFAREHPEIFTWIDIEEEVN